MNAKPTTLREVSSNIEAVVLAETGAEVEITLGESKKRGPFMSVGGTVDAIDAARTLLKRVSNVSFTDRDIDDEDPEFVIDFYATA
jgi:hypothetical protein